MKTLHAMSLGLALFVCSGAFLGWTSQRTLRSMQNNVTTKGNETDGVPMSRPAPYVNVDDGFSPLWYDELRDEFFLLRATKQGAPYVKNYRLVSP